MKASIAIDCRAITWTGAGTYLKNMISRLAQSDEAALTCLGRRCDMEKFEWFSSVKFIEINSSMFSPIEQMELFLKIPECDIFWSPHFNIPLLYSGKLIVTIYDARVVAMPQHVNGVHRRLYARAMFSFLKQKADAVMCLSEFTKSELIKVIDMSDDIIHPIYCGVDDSWFKIKKESSPHSRPFLLFVGNVKPHKNLVNLVSAFKLIANEIPHDLVIIGEKKKLMTIDKKAIIDASYLGDRILFTGYVEDSLLKQYYAHADALAFPSLYEGFGLPALEAMACGCPAVVSNATSLPEVCGDAALYCDPYDPKDIADKIKILLKDIELRNTLIQRGLARARQFTWEKSVAETREVITKVLRG